MAFCIPSHPTYSTPSRAADACSSASGRVAVLQRRCTRYRSIVRQLRLRIRRHGSAEFQRAIETQEAKVQLLVEHSLAGLVVKGAREVASRVLSELPDLVAEGLAQEADRFARTVLQGERGVVVTAHPADRAILERWSDSFEGWRWRENPSQPRGELSLHLTAGTLGIRWRDIVEHERDWLE